MGRIRITIAGLMGLVVFVAVGLASLHHPTRLWANGVFSLALGLNFAAIAAAIGSKGRARSSWAGFAACGWGYLVLALAPGFEATVAPHLITTPWIEWGYVQIDPDQGKPLLFWDNGFGVLSDSIGAAWDQPEPTFLLGQGSYRGVFVPAAPYSFFRIAHSLFAVAAGLAGGLIARYLSPRPDHLARPTTSTTGQS